MAAEYIGRIISLTSISDIRYVGTLNAIDKEAATISLEKVRSLGTEGRKGDPAQDLGPSNNIYDYIVFRASDVKNLSIEPESTAPRPPPPHQLPQDPAILTRGPPNYAQGVPPHALYGPYGPSEGQSPVAPAGRLSFQYSGHRPGGYAQNPPFQPSTSQLQTFPPPLQGLRGGTDGLPSGRQSLPTETVSPQGERPHSTSQTNLQPSALSAGHEFVLTPVSRSQAEGVSPEQTIPPASNPSGPPPARANLSAFDRKSSEILASAPLQALPASTATPPTIDPNPALAANSANLPPQKPSSFAQAAGALRLNGSSTAATPRRAQDQTRSIEQAVAELGFEGPPAIPSGGSSAGGTRRGTRGGQHRAPISARQHAVPPPEAAAPIAVPAREFDFAQANAKFQKENTDAQLSGDSKPLYDRSSSFFDNISSDLNRRDEHRTKDSRNDRQSERQQNLDTFGEAGGATQRGFGARRRGRGRGRVGHWGAPRGLPS